MTLTATAALAIIADWTDLSESSRRDLASAVRAAGRAADLPLDAVLLTPEALRSTLLTRAPRTLGISDGRMRNIRSGLRATLVRAGVLEDDVHLPMSTAWSDLLEGLSSRERAGFVAIARFCSARQVPPHEVTLDVVAGFEAHLTSRTLATNPRKRVGSLRSAWNRNCGVRSGWPSARLPLIVDERQYILPLAAFPESFQADVAAFERRLAGGALADPFVDALSGPEDDAAPASTWLAKPLRPSTVITRIGHCRWAASAVVASGVPISEVVSLVSLVQPIERAKGALRFLYAREGNKPSAGAGHVADVLRIIGKYGAGLADEQLARLKGWGRPVRLSYGGLTQKNQRTIRAAMEPGRDAALLQLPAALMKAARQVAATSPAQATSLAFRAIAVAILTAIPLRLANVIGLRLDQHLFRPDPKRKTLTGIMVPATETKTGTPITVPVSGSLAQLLDEWISDFRGCGHGGANVYLFPGHGTVNKPITPQGFRDAVKDATERYAGVRLTPHQYRHLAAARFLREFPGEYETVRQLLGHAAIETTVRHYAGAQVEVSHRRFDELLSSQRHALRRASSAGRRGPKTPGRRSGGIPKGER